MAEKKPTKTANTNWRSLKATDAAVAKFEEMFKKDMGVDLGTVNDSYDVTSFGTMSLDYAVTIGGWPSGRILEAWGPEHAGKTTLAMLMVAEAQRKYPHKKVAWVDMEQTFDPKWATLLGVDVPALWRPPVKTAEDTADATKRFVESGLCSLVVLDSVGGMIAKMELQKEADEATIGLVAKIVTRMVKQCSPMCKSNDTTVLVVNQVRAVIDSYGPDEDTAGGWALKHVTTMKLQVKRAGGVNPRTVQLDGKPVPVAYQMAIRVQKNKMGPYGQTALVWLTFRASDKWGPVGVDPIAETFEFAKRFSLMGEGKGGNYDMPDGSRVRGEDKVKEYLREHPEAVSVLRGQIMETLEGQAHDEGAESNADDPLGIAGMA